MPPPLLPSPAMSLSRPAFCRKNENKGPMQEPTFQALLLDRTSLFFELLKPNKRFRTLLWECCIAVFQYINGRRCGPSIVRLPATYAKSIPHHLTPTEIAELLSDVGIKVTQLSWYDILWITRCIGKLSSNGSLSVQHFDNFSLTFWKSNGRMQTVLNQTSGRINASTFTLSCLDTAVRRATARITNLWGVQTGYHMKNAAELVIERALRGATAKVSVFVSQRRTAAWRIETCWRRHHHQQRYHLFRSGWIALQWECRQWRKRRNFYNATIISKNARVWQQKAMYLSFRSAIQSLQIIFLMWRACRRRRAATILQSWWLMVLPRRRYVRFRFYCIISLQIKFKYWFHVNRNKKATIIQKVRRGFVCRNNFLRIKCAVRVLQCVHKFKKYLRRKGASVQVQNWCRGLAVRQVYDPIRFSLRTFGIIVQWFLWRRRRCHRRHSAAILLQAISRFAPQRMRFVRVKQKTINMQRAWRHHFLCKRKATIIEGFGRMVIAKVWWAKAPHAIVNIQKVGRCYLQKRKWKVKKDAILTLQSWFRMLNTNTIFRSVLQRRRNWRWCLHSYEAVTYVHQDVLWITKNKFGMTKRKDRTFLFTSSNRVLLLSKAALSDVERLASSKIFKKKSNWYVDIAADSLGFSIVKNLSKRKSSKHNGESTSSNRGTKQHHAWQGPHIDMRTPSGTWTVEFVSQIAVDDDFVDNVGDNTCSDYLNEHQVQHKITAKWLNNIWKQQGDGTTAQWLRMWFVVKKG